MGTTPDTFEMKSTILLVSLCALAALAPVASAGVIMNMLDTLTSGVGTVADGVASGVSTTYNYFLGDEEDTECTWPVEFCKGYNCPHFTCLDKTEEYIVRQYDASKWVSTTLTTNLTDDDISSAMFMRLFGYISGDNENHQKIHMTVPVLIGMVPKADDTDGLGFKKLNMSFFLPMANPPAPTHQQVHLDDFPQMRVYVRYFSGFAEPEDYIDEAKKLQEVLPEGTQYDDTFFYAVGYNSPWWPLFGRRNEVWFIGA